MLNFSAGRTLTLSTSLEVTLLILTLLILTLLEVFRGEHNRVAGGRRGQEAKLINKIVVTRLPIQILRRFARPINSAGSKKLKRLHFPAKGVATPVNKHQ
jgi:hypothetical protein